MKLIASDLDGTLLDGSSELSPGTIDALRAAHAAGVRIVAATGRSHHSALGRLEPAGVIDWAVCSNGATVYDIRSDRVHRHHTIDDTAAAAVIGAVRAALPDVGIAWETTGGHGFDAGFHALHPRLDEMGSQWDRGASPADHRPAATLKILVAHPEIDGGGLRVEVEPLLPDGVTMSHSGAAFVEVTGDGVNKAFALAGLCDELGVAAMDVVAFGDQHNDVAMLQWAGHGIAMGNAHPEAVAAADDQTSSHHDDGVAEAIHRLLVTRSIR